MNASPAVSSERAADVYSSQLEVQNRPASLTRNQIRSAILLNEDSDLWVVEFDYFFLIGLGPTDLNDLRQIGVNVENPEDLLSKHYFSLKEMVEEHYGQWVYIPAKGLTFTHTIDRTVNSSELVITTQIPEFTEPWFKVNQEESIKLIRMSQSICVAVGLSPKTITNYM